MKRALYSEVFPFPLDLLENTKEWVAENDSFVILMCELLVHTSWVL